MVLIKWRSWELPGIIMKDISMFGRHFCNLHIYWGSCWGEDQGQMGSYLGTGLLTLCAKSKVFLWFWHKNNSMVVSVVQNAPSSPTCSHRGELALPDSQERCPQGTANHLGQLRSAFHKELITHRLTLHQGRKFFFSTFKFSCLLFSPFHLLPLPYHCLAIPADQYRLRNCEKLGGKVILFLD